MDNKLETSCNRLKEKINQVENHLSQLTNHLEYVTETEIYTLENNFIKARQECDEKRSKVTDAVHRGVDHFIEDAKNKALTKLYNWKAEHEILKMEELADKKEQQAIDAVMIAAFVCLEAEVVILDALKTRKTVTEVVGNNLLS